MNIKLKLPDLKKPVTKKKKKTIRQECSGKNCLAFDFGTYDTKIAAGTFAGKGARITDLVQVKNSEGLSASDPTCNKEIVMQLKTALSEAGIKIKKNIALCTLPSGSYIRRELELKYLENEDDLNGAVAYSMSRILSMDVESYYFTHSVVKRFTSDEGEMCTVLAAAINKKACESYYKVFTSLGLNPLLMDININGMERYLSELSGGNGTETTVCIDFGYSDTQIEIYEEGRYAQADTVEWGDSDLMSLLRVAARRAGRGSDGGADIAPETAYKIITSGSQDPDTLNLLEKLVNWSSEISSSIRIYRLNHPSRKVSKIILRGSSGQFSWIGPYLESALNISTVTAGKPETIALKGNALNNADKVPQFLNALNLFSGR